MSGKGGGGQKAGIPPASRKMVQSLKEIVSNIPEHEIYATLKDCNMDPNEAVSRLLSQDTFHEVKSKREKKKEGKDTTDSRSRVVSNTSSRGGGARVSADRYVGRGGATQFSSGGDSGLLQGKPVLKKENGTPAYGGLTAPASSALDNNVNRQLPSYSDSVRVCDGLSSSQYGGMQSPWVANPGQVSMADIVRMGRPQAKASMHNSSLHSGSHQNVFAPPEASHNNLHSLQGHASKVSETNNDRGFAINSNVEQNDEWPLIEHQPAVSVSSVVDDHPTSEYHTNSSNSGEANQQLKTHVNEFVAEDDPVENPDNVGSASISEENPESTSVFDGSTYKDINSYQSHRHPFETNEAEGGVSSVAANLEQLNLHSNDQGTEQEEENSSVVIPNHLQLHSAECLNLSFGSFGSANDASLSGSGPYASRPLKSNLEDTSGANDVSTIGSSDVRHVLRHQNPDYYGDEHLTTTSDGNVAHITGVDAGTYEHSSISQSEALKSEPPETAQENQYSFPSSHEFTYENAQQPDVTYPHSQTSSQIQNLSPFSSVMQAYTNSLPSALLASTVQTAREDIPYSPFPATQSMPAKYSNIASSIGGPTINMSEALRANSISTPQPNPQALPGANVATGPALPQHLAVHPYSQPTLPLGHFANMISYPFLPQSYTYMPSAFQQAFPGNSTYHQSLAAMLPQYKNSISVSSLPQSAAAAAVASGYGFGSSTSIPGGNYPLNPPAAPTSTTIGYDDVINSQFKENNHIISLQQNENSPMWVHGPSSRTMSAVPPSTYYSFQGQNQQPGGFRQSQQPSQQHFGSLGYPNFYHSQTGISLEHQQQNPREASLAGSQSQPPKQSQQIWQNSY
ncbi:GBF-interacting protein 1 [Glycine max]|nr:GBF-interacting protein 1 [Glycine max]